MARMNRGTQGWRGIKRFVAKARYKNQEEYSEKFSRYSESPHKERMDNRGHTERPSTYQVSVPKKREGVQSHSRPLEPKLETTGIKSISYYAPREVTDNWRELWDKAEKPGRPKMEENVRRKKNESPELPMSRPRPDSLNGNNPEKGEDNGALKASVSRPVSYQPESREQPGKKRDVVVENPMKVQGRPVSYQRVLEGGERTKPIGESNQKPSEQTERTSERPISYQVIPKDVQKDLPAAGEKKSLKDVPERPVSHPSISAVKENGEAIEGAEQGQVVQQRPQTATAEKREHLEREHTRKHDNVVHGRRPERLKNVDKNKITADAIESTDIPSSPPMRQSVRTEEGKTEEFKSGKMEPGRNT